MTKPKGNEQSSVPVHPTALTNLKKQLYENALEIFVALVLALIGFGFITSFGKYILLIVLIGSLFVVWLHDKPKIIPWVMLAIGILLGFVVGNNTSRLPAQQSDPSLETVLPEQWLDDGKSLRILDGNATLICDQIFYELREAGCEITVIGQKTEYFAFTEDQRNYLFSVRNDHYYVTMIDIEKYKVLITITLVPQELLPTPTPISQLNYGVDHVRQ